MARLVVLCDPLRGVREHHRLNEGETLADELRRLYPQGFNGRWMLHKAQAIAEGEIDSSLHEQIKVDMDATYIVTVRPAGPALPFFGKLLLSFAVSYLIGYITADRHRPSNVQHVTEEQSRQSPNNQIAGQMNRLRAGARVPEILGRVRSFPDLLTSAVEKWFWPRTQSIVQHFVVGCGAYGMTGHRLGDTPMTSIEGVSFHEYLPGDTVPNIQAIRMAPNVDGISLSAQEAGTTVTGVTFDAETRTVSSPTRIALTLNSPYFITGTFLNTVDVWVSGIPDEAQAEGPYVYTLDAIITDEAGVNAVFNPAAVRFTSPGDAVITPGPPPPWGTTDPYTVQIAVNIMWLNPQVGDLIGLDSVYDNDAWGHFIFYGKIIAAHYVAEYSFWALKLSRMDGTLVAFPEQAYEACAIRVHIPGGGTRDVPGPRVDAPEYTGWFTAPMDAPDEIWLDFEFPQGLAHYVSGVRGVFSVSINVQFRQVSAPGTVVTLTYTFTASSNVAQRATEIVDVVSDLAMSGAIEVRMIRTTPVPVDTSTDQYVHETVWRWFRAVKNLPPQVYPDVTIISLVTFNSVSASGVGENTFNVIATRMLPTWTGSAWTAPAATEKWADSLVARMKASDGAGKTDAEIDLAGIYAVQAALDAMDGGDQGKISLTLDEMQDIDTELQTIASVVRCQVYRIGKKLFVTRDEGGKVPLALFTGRSKSPDGEQVQLAMNNETENDAVVVTWFDRGNGWKQRELVYADPPNPTPINPLRVMPVQATWAQAWRRAVYEWGRVLYRRDSLSMEATEEARLLHMGDVINVTDDIANLAQSAGEILNVAGLTLTLDRAVNVSAGGFTIMLRAQDGRAVESMTITQGVSTQHVVLAHAPAFAIKGRDEGLGTVFAIYQSAAAVIRPWLVTHLEPGATYTRVMAVNWREDVFAGDDDALPPVPAFSALRGLPHDDITG